MPDPARTLYDELGVPPDASRDALRTAYRRRARQLHPDVGGRGEGAAGGGGVAVPVGEGAAGGGRGERAGAEERGSTAAGEAIRQLNHAWAVLGNAERRRRYDQELALRFGATARAQTAPDDVPEAALPPRRAPWFFGSDDILAGGQGHRLPSFRPSALLLVALAIIFVVTAYGGAWPGSQGSGQSPTTAPTNSSAVAGDTARPTGSVGATPIPGQCIVVDSQRVSAVDCQEPNNGRVIAVVPPGSPCPVGSAPHPWHQPETVLCAVADTQSTTP